MGLNRGEHSRITQQGWWPIHRTTLELSAHLKQPFVSVHFGPYDGSTLQQTVKLDNSEHLTTQRSAIHSGNSGMTQGPWQRGCQSPWISTSLELLQTGRHPLTSRCQISPHLVSLQCRTGVVTYHWSGFLTIAESHGSQLQLMWKQLKWHVNSLESQSTNIIISTLNWLNVGNYLYFRPNSILVHLIVLMGFWRPNHELSLMELMFSHEGLRRKPGNFPWKQCFY